MVRNSLSSLVVMDAARQLPSCSSASSPNESPLYSVATTLSTPVTGSLISTLTLPLSTTKNSDPTSPCRKISVPAGCHTYPMTRHRSRRLDRLSCATNFMRIMISSSSSSSSSVRSAAGFERMLRRISARACEPRCQTWVAAATAPIVFAAFFSLDIFPANRPPPFVAIQLWHSRNSPRTKAGEERGECGGEERFPLPRSRREPPNAVANHTQAGPPCAPTSERRR
mmetsp:Transcript_2474/g.5550  ORF Transcript_2474/g.5550 Transcript_2474/m.5550 type:complete len:226 (-) Transcript_2474:12-689(-)